MKKILWNDKQLAALAEMIDLQALVEDYINRVVLNLIVSGSRIVTATLKDAQGKIEVKQNAVPDSKVIVPAFIAAQAGSLIETVQTTIDIFAGTAVPATPTVTVIPSGYMGNGPSETPRTDILAVQYSTTTGDSKGIWYIDPVTDQKSQTVQDSREIDTYKWGIIRGTPGGGLPSLPSGWMKVAAISITSGSVILNTNITRESVLGSVADLFDPTNGHKHYGLIAGDGPRLVHGPNLKDAGRASLDPAFIHPNDHHNQVHNIGGGDHSNFLSRALHGFLTASAAAAFSGVLHDFSALPNYDAGAPNFLSNDQHGVRGYQNTALNQLHPDSTISTPGFMSAADKSLLENLKSTQVMCYGITYHGRSINFTTGNYTGGGAAPAGYGAIPSPSEDFNGILPGGFASDPFIFCSPYVVEQFSNPSGPVTGEHNHGSVCGATAITTVGCTFQALNEYVGAPSSSKAFWVQWLALGTPA